MYDIDSEDRIRAQSIILGNPPCSDQEARESGNRQKRYPVIEKSNHTLFRLRIDYENNTCEYIFPD